MLNSLLCSHNSSIYEAWELINKNGKATVFIIDDLKKLCGVVTDGDIRRHLMNGGSINDCIKKIQNQNYVYASVFDNYDKLLEKVNEKIRLIPLIDESHEVKDYFEYSAQMHIPVAVPDLNGNEFKYLMDAFFSTWISSSGEYIKSFEKQFSRFCDCDYGVTVSNGTVALHLALITCGIGPGDEVIIPDLTFAATINAVLHANATPVIVDVETESWCIDPLEIEKAITPRTKAIIPVHLYGQPCDMEAIMDIAGKHNLTVIEDCAEAHGAEFGGKKVGSFGDIGCFSFFGNKVITTGEGGMCVTNNAELDDKMRTLRDHGMSRTKKYWHTEVGYNYRMTNLQAAIGLAQLERITTILEDHSQLEQRYRENIPVSEKIQFQRNDLKNRKKITWLVSIIIQEKRDELLSLLQKNGIDARPFFYSLSDMDIYKEYSFSNKNSRYLSERGINLPTNTTISDNTISYIAGFCNQQREKKD